jgi:hypothetical protein
MINEIIINNRWIETISLLNGDFMKKILVMLFALSSISAFAQDGSHFTLYNKTYPDKMIKFLCLDSECSSVNVSYVNDGDIVDERIIYEEEIDKSASNNRWILSPQSPEVTPYSFAQGSFSKVGKQWKEGEEGKAIGNSIVGVFGGILDTAILPMILFNGLVSPEGVYTLDQGRIGGRRAKRIIYNQEDTKLKESRFREVLNSLKLNK